jgi:hypothetical protein
MREFSPPPVRVPVYEGISKRIDFQKGFVNSRISMTGVKRGRFLRYFMFKTREHRDISKVFN